MSIRENIAYGDTSRENIPIEEIIRVAQTANIHDFIQQLPEVSVNSLISVSRIDILVEGIRDQLWCQRNSTVRWTEAAHR